VHKVAHSAEIDVPADYCFAYVDQFDNIPKFVFGMKSFAAVGPSEPRLGTKVVGQVQLGPVHFNCHGHVSEHIENRLITVQLDEGPITGVTTWRFAPVGSNSCEVSVELSYEIGGGFTGRALAKIIDSILEPGIRYTDTQLREQLVEGYRTMATEIEPKARGTLESGKGLQ